MWMARDRSGVLIIFKQKPNKYKEIGEWGDVENEIQFSYVDDSIYDLFPEIKWEDEEPRELVLNSLEEKERSCEDNRRLLHCNNCGGINILKHAWVDANTLEFAQEDWANEEYWCEDCNEVVNIVEEEEIDESNKGIC